MLGRIHRLAVPLLTSQDLQQKLDVHLRKTALKKRPHHVKEEDAGDHLEVVQLRDEDDEIGAFFSAFLAFWRDLVSG